MVYLFKANINFEITGRDRRRLTINELKIKTIKINKNNDLIYKFYQSKLI